MSVYLVKGDNGGILQWYYDKAYRCRVYFPRNNIKKYRNFEEAETALREHMSQVLPSYVPVPEKIEINDMLTVKKLIKEYESQEGHYANQ